MRIVLDASAAVEIALNRGRARSFTELLEQADLVLSPDLFIAEVVNTLWKYHQFEKLDVRSCDQAIEFAIGLVDTIIPSGELHRDAFLLARTTRRAAYDMFYLAVARREDAALLTVDASFKAEAERQGLTVL